MRMFYMKKPQIQPHFRVEIIEPKNVYLLSEHSTHAFTGKLCCQLAPLLNGNYTTDEIITKLQGRVDNSQIDYALSCLQAKGYLTETVDELTKEAAAFWSLLNVEPQIAYHWLQKISVSLTGVGDVSTQPLIAALEELGIQSQQWKSHPQESAANSLLVVFTDDYLQPDIAQINQIALKFNQPWLLAKPVGAIVWLGPIFYPGKTACWECLAQRLRGHRQVEASILRQQKKQNPSNSLECLPSPRTGIPSTLRTALDLTTTEIAKWIVKQGARETTSFPTLEGKIITFDHTTLDLQTHILTQRPQCPTCGDSNLLSKRLSQPVILNSRKKQFTSDGGHRAFSPDKTIKNYQHLISPITGIVSALVRVSDPDSSLVHTYTAAHSFFAADNLNSLRRFLRHKSAGKGKSDRQAKASGLCEAIERYSGIYQGDEPRVRCLISDLKDKVIHPSQYLHFSSKQYQNRQELNAKNVVPHDWICEPFDESKEIDWTPVWSLTEQIHKYLPTAFCYYDYPLEQNYRFCISDSNGNAAGNTLEEAILQGFMELVERDSVGIWWYNRLYRPTVDLASFDEPYLLELQDFYRSNNRELWVLDLTADLNIPVFAAVSRLIDGEQEKIIAGYGAHLDPKIAILRAVTEVNQFGSSIDNSNTNEPESEWQEWLTKATIENHPYLAPNSQLPAKVYQDYQKRWSDDIYDDVLTCVEIAKNAGMETLVLDQTRPDIGLNVVKVIVPGLRHFWSRFGAGRLYDVPVKMGWISIPLVEEQMNFTSMLF
jgi:ribosomal protein S12 methylthiotransferase accessory factor